METLIICRHADYECCDGSLTIEGREQAERLAAALVPLAITPVAVIASPTPRTRETAGIIAAVLSPAGRLQVTGHDILAYGEADDPYYADEAVYELVRSLSAGIKTLVITTHEPVVQSFGNYLLRQLGAQRSVHLGVSYAEAVVIGCESRELQVLRQRDGGIVIEAHHLRR